MGPRNENWKARCEAGFFGQAAMRTLDVSIASLEPGRVVLTMPFQPDFTQQHGFLHAGTVTTVLDSACGFAAFTLMPADAEVLTVEFKSNFLAPAKGRLFRFEGDVVKSGRTISVTQGRAYSDGVLISTMQATMMSVTAPLA
jgi:uncharacterized protein (TIGR00369 family)